ncbi:MAG TPA: hypothetical protein VGJ10_16815 [Paraburkholderia sp.]
MRNMQHCDRVLVAAAFALLLSTSLSASSVAAEVPADTEVETAGERAHFAQAFCGVSAERVDGYKQQLKKTLHDPAGFDRYWQVGWRRAESGISQMSALREHDPAEFASRIKGNCGRLKWQAENAVRPPARK